MADEAKQKRQITPEQLENLKKGREKGLETRRKNRELKQFEQLLPFITRPSREW